MDVTRLAPARQPGLPPQPFDSLVIDLPALPLKGLRHASIAIAGKVLAQVLQRLAKRLIAIILDRAQALLVIPLPIDIEQPA